MTRWCTGKARHMTEEQLPEELLPEELLPEELLPEELLPEELLPEELLPKSAWRLRERNMQLTGKHSKTPAITQGKEVSKSLA